MHPSDLRTQSGHKGIESQLPWLTIPQFLEGLVRMLEKEEDLQVVAVAYNAADGLQAVLERQPQVAVLDLRLRRSACDDESRLEIDIELLRQIYRKTATLALIPSSYQTPAWVRTAAQAGAYGFYDKDVHAQTLMLMIRTLTRQQLALWPPNSRHSCWSILLEYPSESLTQRELQILHLVEKGWSDRAIAEHLGLHVKTVSKRLEVLRKKFGVHSRTETVQRARQLGLLPSSEW